MPRFHNFHKYLRTLTFSGRYSELVVNKFAFEFRCVSDEGKTEKIQTGGDEKTQMPKIMPGTQFERGRVICV